jgi:hypothetical protein
LIRRAAQEFYTPICFNSHPVSDHTYSAPLVDAVWDQAVGLIAYSAANSGAL